MARSLPNFCFNFKSGCTTALVAAHCQFSCRYPSCSELSISQFLPVIVQLWIIFNLKLLSHTLFHFRCLHISYFLGHDSSNDNIMHLFDVVWIINPEIGISKSNFIIVIFYVVETSSTELSIIILLFNLCNMRLLKSCLIYFPPR